MSGTMQPRRWRMPHVAPSVVVQLARSQLRRSWVLFLILTFGMVVSVVIACLVPLLSTVMLTAGLRNTLRASPDNAEIILNVGTGGLSTPVVQNVHSQFDLLFQQNLGSVLLPEQSAIISNDFALAAPSATNHTVFTVYSTSLQQAVPQLHMLRGRIAHVTNKPTHELEVMLTPDTAQQLHVNTGSIFPITLHYGVNVLSPGGMPVPQQFAATIPARVAGIFTVPSANAAYWHGEDFKTLNLSSAGKATLYQYTALTSEQALLALFDGLRTRYHADAIQSVPGNGGGGTTLLWYYRLDTTHLDINTLGSLISHITIIQSTTDSLYGSLEYGNNSLNEPSSIFPYLASVDLSSPLLSANGNSVFDQYQARVETARIPVGMFAALILALLLFFISLITTLLVERQSDTIAIWRSRGASRSQTFGALLLPGIGAGILALLSGLPVAVLFVLLLTPHMLPPTELDALNTITGNPVQAMLGTIVYALSVVIAMLLTMSLSLLAAARQNVLTLRRETARSDTRPALWQRLNLDILAGAIALAGYGYTLYVANVQTQEQTQVLIANPLALIAPLFLIIGCLLFFFRLFPLLLHVAARGASRGRGAISLLAFAQLARAPRQSVRMTMLLALATAFALFTLIFGATEAQHTRDIVAYQAGADFSGDVYYPNTPIGQAVARYQSIPGVLATSAGYSGQGVGGTANLTMDVRAVDAASFGAAVIWPSQSAYQSAQPLLAQLVSLRHISSTNDIIPAIVDQTTINTLLLHVGSTFTVTVNNVSPSTMQCIIIGVVDHIPTINHLLPSTVTGGVLVDYPTYLSIYTLEARSSKGGVGTGASPTINQVWLHTKNDAASLANVRATLKQPAYGITNLVDRRLLLAAQQSDPLYLVLASMLSIGTVTALLLALVGTLFASWVNVRARVIQFVTLRALGATFKQAAGIFAWEQAVVYTTGLLLGGGFALLLVLSVIPDLTFTSINSSLSSQQFFALQSALAPQIVVPASLALLLPIAVGIFVLALTMMARVVAQPATGQVLRLNED